MIFARTRLLVVAMIATALLAGCENSFISSLTSNNIVNSPSGTTTTLILLRHADRKVLHEELDEDGRARAAALPAALEGVHIDAIYSPDLVRNLDTVAPLAKQRGLTAKIIPTSRVAARLVDEHPGKTVLWVGNKGNLESIYSDIGGEGPPPILYGDLYIARVTDKGPAQVTKSHYGQ